MTKIANESIDKLSFVKTVNELNETNNLHLPVPLHPTIYKNGIFPQDVETWMYTDPTVTRTKRTLELENGLMSDSILETERLLGKEKVESIRTSLQTVANKLGRKFKPRIKLLGVHGSGIDVAEDQVYKYINVYCDNPYNWIVNPGFSRIIGTSSVSESQGFQFPPVVAGRQEVKNTSEIGQAIATLNSNIRSLTMGVKKRLKKTNETWRFRVKSLKASYSMGGDIWRNILNQQFLGVGHFERIERRLLFTDVSYFQKPYVEVKSFDGLDIESREYILYGSIGETSDGPMIVPFGVNRRRPYLSKGLVEMHDEHQN